MTPPIKIPDSYDHSSQADLWSIFKIMGEFVDGYDRMFKIGPCVSVFGSARLKPGDPYYEQATTLASKLTEMGFGVITGGGPGIMEAANKGATESKGKSVGLCINLPFEEHANKYVDPKYTISFNYFFARKVMFIKYAQSFVVFPGGFGTMDELFESLTLIQTHKISRFPVILVGVDFWSGLIEWLKNQMVKTGTINESDLNLFRITDDLDEVIKIIEEFYTDRLMGPNF